jgi:hypothetical protein
MVKLNFIFKESWKRTKIDSGIYFLPNRIFLGIPTSSAVMLHVIFEGYEIDYMACVAYSCG